MCRLPLDLMRKIIEVVKQPLPRPGDPDVTWKDLNQADLVSLMRASRTTYCITAPLLYKEVVINNLSSFFLGIDNPKRDHHDIDYAPASDQHRICRWITKSDGVAYCCPGHTSEPHLPGPRGGTTSLSHPPTRLSPVVTYHKLELLEMVKVVHFVYARQDRTILSHVDIEDYYDEQGQELDLRILDQIDLRRYTDLPQYLKSLPDTSKVLPHLRRFTIGTWLLTDVWNATAFRQSTELRWKYLASSIASELLEEHIADIIPRFATVFMCRQASDGFFNRYPSTQPLPNLNTIHDPNPLLFSPHLMVATQNTLVIEQWDEIETPLARFKRMIWLLADGVMEAIKRWEPHYSDTFLRKTSFTFVLHRDWEYSWAIPTAQEDKQDDKTILEVNQEFRTLFDQYGDGSMDDWKDRCEIIWQDDYPGCPACHLDDIGTEDLEKLVDYSESSDDTDCGAESASD